MDGWIVFIVFLFIGAIVWGIVSGINDRQEAKERGMKFDERIRHISGFTPSQIVNGVLNLYVFAIDKNHRKVAYIKEDKETIIPFEDIISVEIMEDNTTLASKSTMRTVGGVSCWRCSCRWCWGCCRRFIWRHKHEEKSLTCTGKNEAKRH